MLGTEGFLEMVPSASGTGGSGSGDHREPPDASEATGGQGDRESGRAAAAYAARRLLGYRRGEGAQALGYRSAISVAHAEQRVEASGDLRRLARKAAAQVALS